MRRDTLLGILFVNIATLAWATNVIMGRHLRAEIGPFTLTAARYLVSAAVLGWLLRRAAPSERRIGADWWPLAAMAVTGVILFAPLLYLGLRFTTAVNGTLINGIAPLLTALFAAALIREPYSKGQIAGAIMALIGVVALIAGVDAVSRREFAFNPGDLVILTGAALWGLYSVTGRFVMRTRGPLSATALSSFIGLPVLLLAAVAEQWVAPVTPSWRLLLVIFYLGVVPGAIGLPLWNTGIKLLGPGGAMVFYNTLPLYGAILGFAVLGESVSLSHVIGGVLIIGGGLFGALTRPRPAVPLGGRDLR